jgi:hypothetical protein
MGAWSAILISMKMGYKKQILAFIILTTLLLLTSLAWILKYPLFYIGECNMSGDLGCVDFTSTVVGSTLLMSGSILLSLILLLFLKEGVYRTWRKLAVVALPIIALLIAMTPEYNGELISVDREQVTMLTSALFFIVSYIFIGWKAFALRRSG